MLKTRNFIGMDVRLLPASEFDTKKSFPVKKVILVTLLICMVAAIVVLAIHRRNPGTEKEAFIEYDCKLIESHIVGYYVKCYSN